MRDITKKIAEWGFPNLHLSSKAMIKLAKTSITKIFRSLKSNGKKLTTTRGTLKEKEISEIW